MKAHVLCEAIFAGDEAEVRRIIAWDPACVNTPESGGTTALMLCSTYKQPEIARILLAHGADLHARERRGGLSALHLAAWLQCAPLVEILIDAGAAVDEVDDNGNSTLQHALTHYTRSSDGRTISASGIAARRRGEDGRVWRVGYFHGGDDLDGVPGIRHEC